METGNHIHHVGKRPSARDTMKVGKSSENSLIEIQGLDIKHSGASQAWLHGLAVCVRLSTAEVKGKQKAVVHCSSFFPTGGELYKTNKCLWTIPYTASNKTSRGEKCSQLCCYAHIFILPERLDLI